MAISTYTPLPDRIIHNTEVDFQTRTQLGMTVHLVQYDKSLPIVAVALYSNGQPYQIPTGAEMNVRVGKSDGTKVHNPVLGCNANRTICYFEVTQQMTSAYGPGLAILEVIVDSAIAGSSYIPFDIAKNPAQDEAIMSSNEYKSMNELVEEAREALGKPPKIQNGTWWLWDSEQKTYIDTRSPTRGEIGPQGKQGEKGESGKTGNGIASTVLNDNFTLTVHFTDGTSYTTPSIRGATGPQGKQGETGSGFKVLGYYANESALSAAVPNPAAGDAYGIGTSEPYDIYIWDGVNHKWVNNGSLAPVTSVNGATGEVKSTFYVTVTPTGSGYAATADKTAEEVYAAYTAGYAVYAVVKFENVGAPLELPLVAAASISGTFILAFAALGSLNPTAKPQYPTVTYAGTAWMAWLGTLAKESDIPTELKNPNALHIKIGNTTTSYDGSAAKTVEIPKGVPSVTTTDNGKFLRVVNGAWAAAAIDNANGGSF